jgi:adiponectin receptor
MGCTSPSLTVESSYEEINTAASVSGRDNQKPIYRRRHSSFHPRRKSSESMMDGEESLLLKVSATCSLIFIFILLVEWKLMVG